MRRLLDECLSTEETRTDSVIAQFLEKYGASSRVSAVREGGSVKRMNTLREVERECVCVGVGGCVLM